MVNWSGCALWLGKFGGGVAKTCAEMDHMNSFPSPSLTTLK